MKQTEEVQNYEEKLLNMYIVPEHWIIRYDPHNNKHYTLFNVQNAVQYTISNISFIILKVLQENCLTLNQLINYLQNNGIKLQEHEFINFIESMEQRGIVVKTNFFNKPRKPRTFKIFDMYHVPVASSPLQVELHFTNGCNLFCSHCAYDSGKKMNQELEPELWFYIFDQLEELQVQQLIISGGESLLYHDAKNLLTYLTSKKMRVNLFTNATLIDDETGRILSHWNFSTTISLDGADAKTHNMLRGCDCFNKTVKGLEYMSRHKAKFYISTTIHKKNMHQIEQITNFASKLGAQGISFILIDPVGRAKEKNTLLLDRLDREKIRYIIEKIKINGNNNIPIIYSDSSKTEFDDITYIKRHQSIKRTYEEIYCPGGTTRIAIRSDGKVFPCVYAFKDDEFCMGTVKTKTIQEIWESDKWNLFRGGININQLTVCNNCDIKEKCYVKNCRIRPYYSNGEFYGKPPICSKDIKIQ